MKYPAIYWKLCANTTGLCRSAGNGTLYNTHKIVHILLAWKKENLMNTPNNVPNHT